MSNAITASCSAPGNDYCRSIDIDRIPVDLERQQDTVSSGDKLVQRIPDLPHQTTAHHNPVLHKAS